MTILLDPTAGTPPVDPLACIAAARTARWVLPDPDKAGLIGLLGPEADRWLTLAAEAATLPDDRVGPLARAWEQTTCTGRIALCAAYEDAACRFDPRGSWAGTHPGRMLGLWHVAAGAAATGFLDAHKNPAGAVGARRVRVDDAGTVSDIVRHLSLAVLIGPVVDAKFADRLPWGELTETMLTVWGNRLEPAR